MLQHIFISYASDDGRDFARLLHDQLEAVQIPAWLDIHDIQAGEDWNRAIDRALQSAWGLCLALTPGAVASMQVEAEWIDALDRHVPVIPLLVRNCDVPRRLKVVNWIDCRDNEIAGLARLQERLKSLPADHHDYLTQQLADLVAAQQGAPEPPKFNAKISVVKAMLQRWEALFQIQRDISQIAAQSTSASPVNMVRFRRQLATHLVARQATTTEEK